MGRHFEVRAKSMAATAAKKSAINMRASKEAYMAAKSGSQDPNTNLALRAVMEKYRSQGVPRDVFERAIKKASGTGGEDYVPGRYEAFGPGGSYVVVDTLTDNVNRAISEVRAAITKRGGHMGSVIYNFEEYGNLVFKTLMSKDEIEEILILGDVDLKEIIEVENGLIQTLVVPTDFGKTQGVLKDSGITEYELVQIMLLPNETIKITDTEELEKFNHMMDMLDELQDVQEVYHNVEL